MKPREAPRPGGSKVPREGSADGSSATTKARPAVSLSDPPGSPPTTQPAEATSAMFPLRRALPVDVRFSRAASRLAWSRSVAQGRNPDIALTNMS